MPNELVPYVSNKQLRTVEATADKLVLVETLKAMLDSPLVWIVGGVTTLDILARNGVINYGTAQPAQLALLFAGVVRSLAPALPAISDATSTLASVAIPQLARLGSF